MCMSLSECPLNLFSMGGGSKLVHSTRRPLLAYCTCPGWLWWRWRIWWNEDWQGKPKYSEKTYSSATLSTTNRTCQTRARTRAAAVGSQRLTAWAMALSCPLNSFSSCFTRPWLLIWLWGNSHISCLFRIPHSLCCPVLAVTWKHVSSVLINYVFNVLLFHLYRVTLGLI
jgi:hypothetical protein